MVHRSSGASGNPGPEFPICDEKPWQKNCKEYSLSADAWSKFPIWNYRQWYPPADRDATNLQLGQGSPGTDKSRGHCMEMICGLFGGRTFPRCKSGKSAYLAAQPLRINVDVTPMCVSRASSGNSLSGLKQDRPRLRLEPRAYAQLRKQVLERDSWRCQNCGIADNLQVHHRHWRSRMGNDCLENRITLCVSCHQRVHRSFIFHDLANRTR
jgi:hypothetical protein